jgi:hypothetical protein
MKKLLNLMLVTCLLTLLVGCGSSKKGNYPYVTQYLPVMLEGSQKWSILNVETGEVLGKDAFKTAPSAVVDDMFFVANDSGTFDYYNVSNLKRPVNKNHYGSVTEFSVDGYAIASEKGKSLCVIDKDCRVVADLGDSIAEATMFNRGLAVVRNLDGKYGYVDTQGKMAIKPQFDTANPFLYCDEAVVLQRHEQDSIIEFSFIDKSGNVTFTSNTTMYVPISGNFNSDVLPVQKRDTIVCLNADGKEVANPFEQSDTLKHSGFDGGSRDGVGNYIAVKGGKMGVVDNDGKVLIAIKYIDVVDVSATRYLLCEKAGSYILTDKQGKQVGKAKIAHANGTPSSLATRGYIDLSVTMGNIMTMFDEHGFAGIPKGATVGTFGAMLDVAQPEKYTSQNAIVIPERSMIVGFAGPIATATAKGYDFNTQTPVKLVSFEFNANAYDNDTEPQMLDFLKTTIGVNGFVNQGNNVFVSSIGTAVAVGYKNGLFRINYYMNSADVEPLPATPRP